MSESTSPIKYFLSGGFGGICTVIAGHPLDTIKVSFNFISHGVCFQCRHSTVAFMNLTSLNSLCKTCSFTYTIDEKEENLPTGIEINFIMIEFRFVCKQWHCPRRVSCRSILARMIVRRRLFSAKDFVVYTKACQRQSLVWHPYSQSVSSVLA